MAPSVGPSIKLRATLLARKPMDSVTARRNNSENYRVTKRGKQPKPEPKIAESKLRVPKPRNPVIPAPTVQDNSENPQVTNGGEKPKAKVARSVPLVQKPSNPVPAVQNDSENSQVTNKGKNAEAKETKIMPVAPLGLRRSARERFPAKVFDTSANDSSNSEVTKPEPGMNGKNPDWANPKSEHWDVMRFLTDPSQVVVTNLDASPKGNFQYIVNNSIRDPSTYRPDRSTVVSTPKQKAPKQKAPPVHPKLKAHIKNGTATNVVRHYYQEFEPGQIMPIAGRLFDDNQLPPARLKRRRLLPRSHDEASAEEIVKPAPKRIKLALKKPSKKPSKKVPETESENISEVRERLIKTTKRMLPPIAKTNIVMEKRDFNYLQEENFHNRPSINIVIPDHIKAILVDDWENVTKTQQLVPLPHKKPVTQILNDWLEFEKPKRPVGSAQADILEEIVAGLKEYFEKCLGRILLYRFERQQYTDFRQLWDDDESDQKCASDTYGAEHLCRLLVTLPELVAQTNMDLQSVNRLREELGKLTNWIGKNAKDYFVNEYETPGADYTEKARSNN
ncbi:Esa1p-associated factor [Ciborinia camelliae]|nr:Esa1p-associated factor [Ciborinia camelliae]